MSSPLDTYLKLYRFPTAWRLHTLRSIQIELARGGVEALSAQVEAAIDADQETLSLEGRWRRRSRAEHAPQAPGQAAELVRLLSGLHQALSGTGAALGVATPRGARALELRRCLFPLGLGALVQQPYSELVADVELVLGRVRDRCAQAVAELGLEACLDRVGELNAALTEGLFRARRGPAFAEVAAARRAGDLALRQIVAQLLAGLVSPHAAACAEALDCVSEDSRALRRLRRRRQRRRARRRDAQERADLLEEDEPSPDAVEEGEPEPDAVEEDEVDAEVEGDPSRRVDLASEDVAREERPAKSALRVAQARGLRWVRPPPEVA